MARFYPYSEITGKALPPIEDLQWIGGQMAQTRPFVQGNAVLCGSVCWGTYSWGSDIDIAHYSTVADPHIEPFIEQVSTSYSERTQGRFIVPRFDVIAIGADSVALAAGARSVSAPALSQGTVTGEGLVSNLFLETAVHFSDHIGALAELNGDPWKAFHMRYLAAVRGDSASRRSAIKRYVAAIATEWAGQPLHRFNLGQDGRFTAQQLDLIGKSENYAVNLMRRILGETGAYPRPDRASDVREAFARLNQPWSKNLENHFRPFFSIGERYERIVAGCKSPDSSLTEADYYNELRALFVDLPFAAIQQTIWEYLHT